MFQDLGFEPEALLSDFVRDGAGEFHDLMLLTHRADEQLSRQQVLGLNEVALVTTELQTYDERYADIEGRRSDSAFKGRAHQSF